MPIMMLLANLTKGPGEKLRLGHETSPIKVDPEVRTNTGSQVNCIGEEVFKQFGLPDSVLTGPGKTKKKGNSDLGKIWLEAYHKHQEPIRIQFYVIRGLGN